MLLFWLVIFSSHSRNDWSSQKLMISARQKRFGNEKNKYWHPADKLHTGNCENIPDKKWTNFFSKIAEFFNLDLYIPVSHWPSRMQRCFFYQGTNSRLVCSTLFSPRAREPFQRTRNFIVTKGGVEHSSNLARKLRELARDCGRFGGISGPLGAENGWSFALWVTFLSVRGNFEWKKNS